MSGAVARAIGAADAMTFDVSNACAGTLTGVTILNNWMRANALRVARWVSAPAVVILATFGLWTQLAHGKGWTWLVLGVVVVALLAAVTLVAGGTGEGWAFLSTSVMVGGVVVLIFGCLYPNLLPSTLNPDWSLTIFNSSSSPYTLRVMTWAALIVAPLVVAYQAWSYWVFRQRISAEHVVTAGGLRRRPQ
jgi:cytochrome d ubiquinol oxidase subunit II